MTATVLEFKTAASPIAQFVRVDHTHIRLGELHAAGRLPIRRAVFDASRIASQREFVDALKRDGVEIVLDTEVAELAAKEKYQTHVKKAPWAAAAEGGLLDQSYFDGTKSQMNIAEWIARLAVELGVDTVLAPTHFLADKTFDSWLEVDARTCHSLRKALDRQGGKRIAIDYPIIHSHTALNQLDVRNSLIERALDLPIDNVWIRASGLGSDPKPQSAKQFFASLYDFQRTNKPLILDYSDGLVSLAGLAFGTISGLAHGVRERFVFNAGTWHLSPKKRDESTSFGRTVYVPIPRLGRRMSKNEVKVLSGAKGGKKLLGCQDECCAHGVRNMLDDPKQHTAHQSIAPVRAMANVPDLNREDYFISNPLLDAERLARNLKDLNPTKHDAAQFGVDTIGLKARLAEHHRKIGKFSDMLSLLHQERGASAPRAKPCLLRIPNPVSDHKRSER